MSRANNPELGSFKLLRGCWDLNLQVTQAMTTSIMHLCVETPSFLPQIPCLSLVSWAGYLKKLFVRLDNPCHRFQEETQSKTQGATMLSDPIHFSQEVSANSNPGAKCCLPACYCRKEVDWKTAILVHFWLVFQAAGLVWWCLADRDRPQASRT